MKNEIKMTKEEWNKEFEKEWDDGIKRDLKAIKKYLLEFQKGLFAETAVITLVGTVMFLKYMTILDYGILNGPIGVLTSYVTVIWMYTHIIFNIQGVKYE